MTDRPTPAETAAAAGPTVPDVWDGRARVVFCGINPGLYSAATGRHFARPGNRFWPALAAAGLTPRRLAAAEQSGLLDLGYGITNLVARSTASADEVTPAELRAGAALLAAKVRQFRPAAIAFLGLGAYRTAFGRPKAVVGRQPEAIEGAAVWLLPNPSGLNAHFQVADLARLLAPLREVGA